MPDYCRDTDDIFDAETVPDTLIEFSIEELIEASPMLQRVLELEFPKNEERELTYKDFLNF